MILKNYILINFCLETSMKYERTIFLLRQEMLIFNTRHITTYLINWIPNNGSIDMVFISPDSLDQSKKCQCIFHRSDGHVLGMDGCFRMMLSEDLNLLI